MNISPRFMRIAQFVRDHGFRATCGVEIKSGREFVDVEMPFTSPDLIGVNTLRAYSKYDATRILGY